MRPGETIVADHSAQRDPQGLNQSGVVGGLHSCFKCEPRLTPLHFLKTEPPIEMTISKGGHHRKLTRALLVA